MRSLLTLLLSRSRTVLMLFVLLLSLGALSYITIPKESTPDIPIPVVLVSVHYEGISPEDSERLLVLPLEKELRGIAGIKEMTSTASQSRASITVEFIAGLDIDKVMAEVRDKVTQAKSKLPKGSDEPVIEQITMASMQPVITVILSGELPERALVKMARELKDVLESRRQILEVDIGGDREDVIDVVIDPLKLESYGLEPLDVINRVTGNNQLVTVGSMDNGRGRFTVKVPAVYETPADILTQPVKVDGSRVVTFADIASIRSTFKEGGSYASMNGQPSVSLEVKKRPGENIIETIEVTKAIISEARRQAPENLRVDYSRDESLDVQNNLMELQNNVLSAVILVVIVILGALGLRSSMLVGLAIPGAFLTGILIIAMFGLTINMVVLFALIMSVGMLVDGAIVVTEFADRKMSEGTHRKEAYLQASLRMAGPITASTATTLAAFAPLMFWPGMMGEFMKFLPLTLIATLSASLLMALLFIPSIGMLIGKPRTLSAVEQQNISASESGDLINLKGFTGRYIRLLNLAIQHSGKVVIAGLLLVAGVYWAFAKVGQGTEFFPSVETKYAQIKVLANSSNYSIDEKYELMQQMESRLLPMALIKDIYTRTGSNQVIGTMNITLHDWLQRPPAAQVMDEIEQRLSAFAGLDIIVQRMKDGPPAGTPLKLSLTSENLALLNNSLRSVERVFREHPDVTNIEHNGSTPGYEWQMKIDRSRAARYGADVVTTGNLIRLVTSGLMVGSYRPENNNDEVDIRIRFPKQDRHMDSIDRLRLMTQVGLVPISNFTERSIASKVDNINHTNGLRSAEIGGTLTEGAQLSRVLPEVLQTIAALNLPPEITIDLKGEQQDLEESQNFLIKAFIIALFVMTTILVSQFNRFYQAFLIMSAVILSTGGVLLGLLIINQPFGIVMSGIGVISLAGIIVNNNIVLIDTYNTLRARGMDVSQAILRTGAQRLRPVLLTTVTTILGLLPMVLSTNINLFEHHIEMGAPSTQMWNQLSVAIASGLSFATLLTLFITPCLLVLFVRRKERKTVFNPVQEE